MAQIKHWVTDRRFPSGSLDRALLQAGDRPENTLSYPISVKHSGERMPTSGRDTNPSVSWLPLLASLKHTLLEPEGDYFRAVSSLLQNLGADRYM